jgi:hypothetical protein
VALLEVHHVMCSTPSGRRPGLIEVIAAKLAGVREGGIRRLIINLPPRHLKSLLAPIARVTEQTRKSFNAFERGFAVRKREPR